MVLLPDAEAGQYPHGQIGVKGNVRQRLHIEPHDPPQRLTPNSDPTGLGHAIGGERECTETIAYRNNSRAISPVSLLLHPLRK